MSEPTIAESKNTKPAPGTMRGIQADDAGELATLRAEVADLKKLIEAKATNAVEVKHAQAREEWFLEQSREISKGNVVRTQEEADRRFPKGQHKWRCVLTDGNLHPEVVVRADNAVDAAGRYANVCGINSHEKQIDVVQV